MNKWCDAFGRTGSTLIGAAGGLWIAGVQPTITMLLTAGIISVLISITLLLVLSDSTPPNAAKPHNPD